MESPARFTMEGRSPKKAMPITEAASSDSTKITAILIPSGAPLPNMVAIHKSTIITDKPARPEKIKGHIGNDLTVSISLFLNQKAKIIITPIKPHVYMAVAKMVAGICSPASLAQSWYKNMPPAAMRANGIHDAKLKNMKTPLVERTDYRRGSVYTSRLATFRALS